MLINTFLKRYTENPPDNEFDFTKFLKEENILDFEIMFLVEYGAEKFYIEIDGRRRNLLNQTECHIIEETNYHKNDYTLEDIEWIVFAFTEKYINMTISTLEGYSSLDINTKIQRITKFRFMVYSKDKGTKKLIDVDQRSYSL